MFIKLVKTNMTFDNRINKHTNKDNHNKYAIW